MGDNIWMNLTAEQARAAFDAVKDKGGAVSAEALTKFQAGKDLTAEQMKLLPMQKGILRESFEIQKKAPGTCACS